MGLKKIELIGFKSFADKEVIVFENGVTGIVGPNGCGKSNVSDAIKWVIGETSAKQLRGKSMQDVIFNGTEARKSLSCCEVSLFFDNSEQQFDLPYEEVVFTRKLFKNGDSYYYINGKAVRLKDFVSNFHDVGISKEGYSIIGQGKVADIMSSKPADRRAIFEEAVGIAKTKKEKLDSERNLERARDAIRQHAIRVADSEKRLAPLAAQSEKTLEFNKLSQELKFHEVNAYIVNFEGANGKREVINQKIDKLVGEINEFNEKLYAVQTDYNLHNSQINSTDSSIASLNSKILTQSIGLTKKEGDIKVFNERIGFLKAEIDRLVKENSSLRYSIEDLREEDKLNKSKKVICEKEVEELKGKVEKLNAKITEITLKIEESEQKMYSAQDKALESAENLAKIMQSIGSLEAEQNVLKERLEEIIEKLNSTKSLYNRLIVEKNALDNELKNKNNELNSYKLSLEQKDEKVSQIDTKIESITEKIYALNSELSAMESKYSVYSRIRDSYEGYNNVIQRIMKDAKVDRTLASKVKGVVAGVVSTKKDYEIAIETALGASAQHVITETPDDAKYILEYLKKNKIGRLTCLPITSVKARQDAYEVKEACREKGAIGLATELVNYDREYEPVIRFLLGNTLICKDNDSALQISKKYRFAFKIVTLDGQVYSPSGTMTGGSVRQQTSGLLSVDTQVSQIEGEIDAKRKEMISLKQQKGELMNESDALFEELNTINQKISAITKEIAVLNEKLAVNASSLESAKVDLTGYQQASEIILGRITGLSDKVSSAQSGNQQIMSEKETLSSDSKKEQAELDALKTEKDKLVAEYTELSTMLATKMQDLVNVDNEINRISIAIKNNEQKILANNQNIASNNEIIESIKNDVEKQGLTAEEQAELDALKAELKELEDKKKALAELVKKDEELRQELQNKISDLTEKKYGEENKLVKINSDLEFFEERVQTQYGLDYQGCLELKQENYDMEFGASETKRLKTRINFLGPINPNAPAEYEAENGEYLTLLAQKEDMEKAAEDIDKVVKILEEEMTEQFNKGFAEIREYFKTVFKVMFGGGDADLIVEPVEEGGDPLDAGIEIKAQPPGKSLRSISLLSGGEQALTAIAILFAILKYRPLPFCVLDEIEAALDDTNVARFANYLKKFSEDTQFIVITHKKPTMERADSLYGVTMPEKGVSKMVSVKLTDVNRIGAGR